MSCLFRRRHPRSGRPFPQCGQVCLGGAASAQKNMGTAAKTIGQKIKHDNTTANTTNQAGHPAPRKVDRPSYLQIGQRICTAHGMYFNATSWRNRDFIAECPDLIPVYHAQNAIFKERCLQKNSYLLYSRLIFVACTFRVMVEFNTIAAFCTGGNCFYSSLSNNYRSTETDRG